MTFRATYMPSSQNPPHGKGGFDTEEDAWEWVLQNRMCSDCKEELAAYDRGERDDEENGKFVSAFPPCSCEWLVFDEDKDAEEEYHKNGLETIMPLYAYIVWHKKCLELEDEQRPIHPET